MRYKNSNMKHKDIHVEVIVEKLSRDFVLIVSKFTYAIIKMHCKNIMHMTLQCTNVHYLYYFGSIQRPYERA